MTLLDFEANNSGYCYIQKTDGRDFKLRISEYRKLLVKIHNVNYKLIRNISTNLKKKSFL